MIKTSILTSIILLSLCFITSGCHNTNDKNNNNANAIKSENEKIISEYNEQLRILEEEKKELIL